jgi:prenyltransferase beta subunit
MICSHSHAGGEVDCRGCYTAVATLHMLNLDKAAVLQLSSMAEFIGRCQARNLPFPLLAALYRMRLVVLI